MKRTFAGSMVIASVMSLMLGVLQAPSAGAVCTGPTVAVMGAEFNAAYVNDVIAKLDATCRFSAVTAVDIMSSTPTLATLETYDAVIVWTNYGPADRASLGDALADYAAAGHRVVLGVFSFSSTWSSSDLEGALPLTIDDAEEPSKGAPTIAADVAGSPLLAGVASFDGGTESFRAMSTLTAGAVQVAHWTGAPKTPFVAAKGNIVALNVYPVSNDVFATRGWDATTDGGTLMANALLASAYLTTISETAPSPVPAGTRVKISGLLAPHGGACPQKIAVVAGSVTKSIEADHGGAYVFRVEITKRTVVKVSYPGDAVCSAAHKKKVIRVA